ncbi:acetylornithine transaminase [Niveibacterium terrae]|uniref:acetylornithine transaminase n=1 Tax=Niveibacterium terrae TaxID=3373598 RepID=UPI003A8DF354
MESTDSLMAITPRPELVFARGEGGWLFDERGQRYLDWVQGWAVNCLGHSPAIVADAIAAQAATLINPSPSFYNRPALELAKLLTAKSAFDQVFFANSGAEANEGAIKLARKWGQKHKGGAYEIITFADAFHGRTLATMSACGKPGWDRLFAPQVEGFPKARFNDIASVEALVSERTVAVMIEPIQGEAGVIPARRAFADALQRLCRERGLLLIVDEVQTGCGRTGMAFAHEALGLEPDIMTLGKGLGGGLPLSALLAKKEVCCFDYGDQGGTFCGNPLACAAGLAAMRAVLDEDFLAAVRARSETLRAGLSRLSASRGFGEVRGSGLLLALDLKREVAAELVSRARDAGLLLNAPRPHLLRLMPALNISDAEIAEGLALLERVLDGMALKAA